jgi:exosortase A-associated hydrolase 2
MRRLTEAFFMPDGRGGLLHAVLHRPADDPVRASVVLAQAWGPEMNFSRRHVAQTCRELAAAGCMVLIVDLYGTGDSHGNPEDGTWQRWAADLHHAVTWLQERQPGVPLWVWGHRAGALVAAAAWPKLAEANLLLWQPVASLAELRREWERQLAATAIANGRPAAHATESVLQAWREGRAVEIAGTAVAAALALDETAPTLGDIRPVRGSQMAWMSLSRRVPAQPSGPTQAVMSAWVAQGGAARWRHAATEPFWLVAEAERSPELARQTVLAVLGGE